MERVIDQPRSSAALTPAQPGHGVARDGLSATAPSVGSAGRWPELPWQDWEPTISTLHMWAQIVGKIRLALTPPINHWWHVPLYVSARGLTTTAIPYDDSVLQLEFDFVDHRLVVTDGQPGTFAMELAPRSVADFYRELMAGLRGRGIEVKIRPRPVEVVRAIPFEEDELHHEYDSVHAERFWRGLVQADRVLKVFRSRFVGKASPVHFFWGGFDLAATRFSGRPAPAHPGGIPNCPDSVMIEAYSHQLWSAGWWPLSEAPGPAFYAYAYPEPEGFRRASVQPADAFYDPVLREYLLPYDAVRDTARPDTAVLEFLQSTYEAAADLGGWDRQALEITERPALPPAVSGSLGR